MGEREHLAASGRKRRGEMDGGVGGREGGREEMKENGD